MNVSAIDFTVPTLPGHTGRTVATPTAPATVAVTGATGLLGNNVVRLLVNRRFRVRALSRSVAAAERTLDGLPVDVVVTGLGDGHQLAGAFAGCQLVFHSAAHVHCGWRHLAEMRETNVEGTRRVARAARVAGARLIHVSSVDAIGLRSDGVPADEETPAGGMPECPYVVTKREAEEAVLEEVERGLDAVIVNPTYMLGPWDWKPSSGRMLLEVGHGWGTFAPPGANDFVDVRDVAAGALAAAERGRTGRRYILGGHPLPYLDAWRVFARIAGRMQPLGAAPEPVIRLAGWCGDAVSLFTARELPVNSAATSMSLLPHLFSSHRARTELGYSSRPFETTVGDAWQWFIDHGFARVARGRPVLAR
jgi:dihydroflavonol-4-reductase